MRDTSFFDGVRQTEVEIRGEAARVPAFYYDATSMPASVNS